MDNTQLPAEVVEEIDNKAASYARKNGAGRFAWRAGATEYVTKLHQELQQKEKAINYLQRLSNVISWLELPNSANADFINEIKTFLDGTK